MHQKDKKALFGQRLATLSLAALMVFSLAGCGGNGGEDSSTAKEVLQAQQQAQDEFEQYDKTIKAKDVLEGAGELAPVDNIVKDYVEVSTEDLEEMAAYQSTQSEAGGPTYIFIGKMKDGADANVITSQLADTAAKFDGTTEEGTEPCSAASGQYVFMAAGQGSADIAHKFTQVIAVGDATSCKTVYSGLSADLTKAGK